MPKKCGRKPKVMLWLMIGDDSVFQLWVTILKWFREAEISEPSSAKIMDIHNPWQCKLDSLVFWTLWPCQISWQIF